MLRDKQAVMPNYESGSIINLVSSITKNYGIDSTYSPLKDMVLPDHKKLRYCLKRL